jgi:cholesterol transport system auxiliary component
MSRRMLLLARCAGLLFVAGASACTLVPAQKQGGVQFHTWDPVLAIEPAPKPTRSTLLISTPQAFAGYDTPRMLYMTQPYTLGYYADHQWVDTMPRMFGPLLVEALQASGHFRSVLPMPTSLPGDYRLDADIALLRHEFLQRPSAVRINVRAQLVNLRTTSVLGQRTFEVVESAPSDDPYGGVLATNRALSELLGELARWTVEQVSGGRD